MSNHLGISTPDPAVRPAGSTKFDGRVCGQSVNGQPATAQNPATAQDSATTQDSAATQNLVATQSPVTTEAVLAEVLAQVLGREQVPVDDDFFADLGADSMVMARFCALVRKRAGTPAVSMRDVYAHPTISGLATALDGSASAGTVPTQQSETGPPPPVETVEPVSNAQYLLTGALQVLIYLAYAYAGLFIAGKVLPWMAAPRDLVGRYVAVVIVGGGGLLTMGLLPILAKWVLIGRWRPRQVRVWTLDYLRFWVVKTLLRSNPLARLLVGTPLYNFYLRALGAKVGRHVVFMSRTPPLCTDLLTIGAGTIVRKEAFLVGYRAQAGRIQIGSVTLGRNAFVGEKAVLDIDTAIGDGAQLGHASVLGRGARVPDGQRWHGCPAEPTDVDYVRVEPVPCGTWRRLASALRDLVMLFFVYVPLGLGGLSLLLHVVPPLEEILGPGYYQSISGNIVVVALVVATVLYVGGIFTALLVVGTVPRFLNLFLKPGKVYRLYGFHHWVHRSIVRLTNVKLLLYVFGESSYITWYLRFLGYDLSKVVQTGVNFGLEVKHENPYLVRVGSGTMVADGLSVINADYSNSSFRVCQATIGADNFLGNNIVYPPGSTTGENCLLATKVMIPLEGPPRNGVGLLGAPPFTIPRSVERDSRFDHLRSGDALRRNVSAKNRYDLRTIALFLFVQWLFIFLLLLLQLTAFDVFAVTNHLVTTLLVALGPVVTAGYFAVVEGCFTAFRPLQPTVCSIYDSNFWRHERIWKLLPGSHFAMFDGTPFKPLLWRLHGARVGKRVFDDGGGFTERTLVTIGDDCTLNQGSWIQPHSQEDGTFKSDRSTLGAGCTLGVAAHVHYGVTMRDHSVLEADSFLMKGEEVPQHALWAGNPAREIPR